MAFIGLFQCDPRGLPTQNWLKNAANDISIQEFHNITRHYVKDTGILSWIYFVISILHIIKKLLPHTPFSSLASGGEREKNSGKMAGFPQWAYWPFCSLFSCSALTAIRDFFTKLFKTN